MTKITVDTIKEIIEKDIGNDYYKKFFNGEYDLPRKFRISIPCMLKTEDYSIFQSEPHRLDKQLLTRGNSIPVDPNNDNSKLQKSLQLKIERAECHESKIKQEIRRTGKRLLRKLEVDTIEIKGTQCDVKTKCHIPDGMCGSCMDCIVWGYAASPNTSKEIRKDKHSRVEVGTTFSIRSIHEIMVERTWNAIDESTQNVQQSFGLKEQIAPEVYMPYVVDLIDVNLIEFIYSMYSLINAGRAGAGSTKCGSFKIFPISIYFTYEQIFANLPLVRGMYTNLFLEKSAGMNARQFELGFLGEITDDQVNSALKQTVNKYATEAPCHLKQLSDKANIKLMENLYNIFKDLDTMKQIVTLNG